MILISVICYDVISNIHSVRSPQRKNWVSPILDVRYHIGSCGNLNINCTAVWTIKYKDNISIPENSFGKIFSIFCSFANPSILRGVGLVTTLPSDSIIYSKVHKRGLLN